MTEPTKLDFTMDPNLLVSVIKMQAGTLSKALLEGIMNSLDAGATRVDVTVDTQGFKISDNGRGFASEQEIKDLFGRFGTPHVDGDAMYGRFRMGRGQMMAFAVTTWRSGPFQMDVDIEKHGLSYQLKQLETPARGCQIEGRLYKKLYDWDLRDTLNGLRKLITYTPKPVYVNGELYGASPERLQSWTVETEDAYIRLSQSSDALQVYNQGVFVEEFSASRFGMGGVVVSKQALQVNFARNSVMEDQCSVWRRIRERFETLVIQRLSTTKALNDAQRKFLAGRLNHLDRYPYLQWRDMKLLTDASGKHVPLTALRHFKRFVFLEDSPTLACAVQGVEDTFVVTGATLSRFGVNSLQQFLDRMQFLGGLLRSEYEVIDAERIKHLGLGGAKELETDGLTKKERAAFATLTNLNGLLADRLIASDGAKARRELRVGTHRASAFVAWTDGAQYIMVNRKFLKLLHKGVDGVLEWLLTLIHEYTHDTDDSESHDHGEVFYRKFHDVTFRSTLELASLARIGAQEYLRQLHARAIPRPRRLMKQLRE